MKTKQTSALSTTAVSAIAASFCDALSANENTGSLLHTLCETTLKYTRGEALAESDRINIVARIVKERGWKGASADARKSECNVILKAAHLLPEAIKAFRKRADKCQWHDGMALARKINGGKSPSAAVSALLTKKKADAANYSGRVAGALKSWWANVPRKRADIEKAAKVLNLTVEFGK